MPWISEVALFFYYNGAHEHDVVVGSTPLEPSLHRHTRRVLGSTPREPSLHRHTRLLQRRATVNY